MTRFIFITGGVVSSLGKGITSASLGAILEARGLKTFSEGSAASPCTDREGAPAG